MSIRSVPYLSYLLSIYPSLSTLPYTPFPTHPFLYTKPDSVCVRGAKKTVQQKETNLNKRSVARSSQTSDRPFIQPGSSWSGLLSYPGGLHFETVQLHKPSGWDTSLLYHQQLPQGTVAPRDLRWSVNSNGFAVATGKPLYNPSRYRVLGKTITCSLRIGLGTLLDVSPSRQGFSDVPHVDFRTFPTSKPVCYICFIAAKTPLFLKTPSVPQTPSGPRPKVASLRNQLLKQQISFQLSQVGGKQCYFIFDFNIN